MTKFAGTAVPDSGPCYFSFSSPQYDEPDAKDLRWILPTAAILYRSCSNWHQRPRPRRETDGDTRTASRRPSRSVPSGERRVGAGAPRRQPFDRQFPARDLLASSSRPKMNREEKSEWERKPGESSKGYGHFCLYRDAGKERSLRKLAADAKTTSKLRQLQHWSA